jgi:hypothetical protein
MKKEQKEDYKDLIDTLGNGVTKIITKNVNWKAPVIC